MKNIIILVSLLYIVSCTSKKETPTEQAPVDANKIITVTLTEPQLKNANIALGAAAIKNVGLDIKVSGTLDVPPQNLISISVQMGGYVRTTKLLQGIHVQKGEVLATLENSEYIQLQLDYLDAKNKLALAKSEFNRQEELSKENVSSAKIFQQVSTDYQNLQNATKALAEKLKMIGINADKISSATISSKIEIRSPISGYVTTVNVNVGKFVTPNDVLAEIVDIEHLHAELSVFEKDILHLRKGQKVTFNLINEPNTEYNASVFLVNYKINDDRTVRVHAHLDKNYPNLIPGMYLSAIIHTDGFDAITLNNDAIVEMDGQSYIFVQSDNNPLEYKAIPVKKGLPHEGFSEVTIPQEYAKNNKIVVKGTYTLLAMLTNTEEE